MGRKKWDQAPPVEGAYSKQSGLGEGQTKTLSAQMARASHGVERVSYLNPDAFSRFIGPKNWGQALINDELTTCLLDSGAQLNFITPAYAVERGANSLKLVLPCWALKLVFSSSCSHGLPGFLVPRRALLFWGIFVRGFARRDLC